MDTSRRDFIRVLTGLGVTASLGGVGTARADSGLLPGYPNQFGVLVDTTVCIGCRRCEWACKEWNKLPNQKTLREYERDQSVFQKIRQTHDDTYTVVNRFENPRDASKPIYVKKQCMHSHENPRWGFIDLGFYHASNLRKAGRLKKFRIRGLHGSLQFVVLTGDWSCCYSSS